jgi:hypothetical protein
MLVSAQIDHVHWSPLQRQRYPAAPSSAKSSG